MNTPQELLDKIHESGIVELSQQSSQWSASQKKAEIKLVRTKLKAVKQQIKAAKNDIASHYDARNPSEKRQKEQAFDPFDQIEALLDEIEIGITEIETGREPQALYNVLPHQFMVGGKVVDLDSAIATIADHIIAKQGVLARNKNKPYHTADSTGERVFQILGGGSPQEIEKDIAALQAQAQYIESVAAQRSGITPSQPLLQIRLTNNMNTIRRQLEEASVLIKQGNLEAAREILEKTNHPRAQEWLTQIYKKEGQSILAESQIKSISKPLPYLPPTKKRGIGLPIILILLILAVGFGYALYIQGNVSKGGQSSQAAPSWTPETPSNNINAPSAVVPPTTAPYISSGGGLTLCGDGTYSSSSGSGTCSYHKGVKKK